MHQVTIHATGRAGPGAMPVIAGVDVGNATTEVAILAEGRLLGVDRLPTRGRKGSPESLRGAAALVRRLERRLGCQVDEARVAPLRAVDTRTLTIPHVSPPAGRLRLLAAGVATPGGTGAWVGAPLWLDRPPAGVPPGAAVAAGVAEGVAVPPGMAGPAGAAEASRVAVVPPGFGYARAAGRLRDLIQAGIPIGAVLVAGDEGVLVANRLAAPIPVIDQVDAAGVAACSLVAVEVRPPGQPLTLLTDPVALGASLGLGDGEARDAVTVCRALLDQSNAVVGCLAAGAGEGGQPGTPAPEPWVLVRGRAVALREAARGQQWPVGTVSAFGTGPGATEVDDLFALDLGVVGDAATARRGSLGRAALVASLHRAPAGPGPAGLLAELLGRPVRCLLTEPAAARLGTLTTPGAQADAVVVDVGAGTIDVITPGGEVVAAGAGELLTAAIAETLGIPRAAAEWVKRGPCLRVDGAQRYEAEDGSRGFLDRPAPATAAGMLAVAGPAGLLPFGRGHSPTEWRAIRLRLKEAVFAVNLRRALGTAGTGLRQVLIAGGPAGDDEMLGVLARSLPDDVAVGRANVGGTIGGLAAGHRYAAALGLALARDGGTPS
jgi:Diol dehydratase reactivase ATPase-like domain/DD-reactivating factor swiveling domain